ncbi:MAG TPA: hypothetical protein VM008_18370 [Phycisphaerae bacterium]|nr:hypothetical protein [Phycisphaerae bacterium]
MAVVLEYAAAVPARRKEALSPFSWQLLLAYAHASLCWQIAQLMIVSVCSHLHPNFVAWTPIAWLPGGITALYLGKVAGTAVMFLSSAFAGHMMHGLLVRWQFTATTGHAALLHEWRTWATAAIWMMWIPVPALYAFAYQFSEWATQR